MIDSLQLDEVRAVVLLLFLKPLTVVLELVRHRLRLLLILFSETFEIDDFARGRGHFDMSCTW